MYHAFFSGWLRTVIWSAISEYLSPKKTQIISLISAWRNVASLHYESTPIQIYWKFYNQKKKKFQTKNSYIFYISVQNIDCEYTLEPPQRGGSNEYPQSMLFQQNMKNNVYPCKPQFYFIKVGFKGSKLYRSVFEVLSKMCPVKILIRLREMRRLIWIFAGRTCSKVRFLALRLNYLTTCASYEDSDQPTYMHSLTITSVACMSYITYCNS